MNNTAEYRRANHPSYTSIDREEYLNRAHEFASRGESLPHSRLTEDKVRDIRATWESPIRPTAKSLAEYYGVHIRTIEKVVTYETWRHVR